MHREKNEQIELLRVISCFLVVCIHVSNFYSRSYGKITDASYIFSIITNTFSRVAVPIFFMISGYLLISEYTVIKKSIKRVLHTAATLVLWSVIYYVWNLWYRQQEYDFSLLFKAPVKRHLWFLYAILGIYIALPFLQCLLKNMPPLLMKYFVILWFLIMTVNYGLALFDMQVTYQVPLIGNSCYLGYFIMGYLIRCFVGRIPVKHWECYLVATFSSVITVFATVVYSMERGMHVDRFLEYRNVLIAISAVCVFIAVMQRDKITLGSFSGKLVHGISRHSFTIYLSHILFLDVVKKECEIRELSAFVGIPVYTCLVFVVSYVFSVLFDGVCKGIKRKNRNMPGEKVR